MTLGGLDFSFLIIAIISFGPYAFAIGFDFPFKRLVALDHLSAVPQLMHLVCSGMVVMQINCLHELIQILSKHSFFPILNIDQLAGLFN